MSSRSNARLSHQELLHVIRQVRRRWRMKIALRGVAIVAAAAILVLFASSFAMDRFAFAPGAVTAARFAAYGILAALAVRFILVPLFRRVPDERVALYLEEHEPSLQAAILSALELGSPDDDRAQRADLSPALIRRLVESAIQKVHEVEDGRRVDAPGLRHSSGALGALAAAGIVAMLLSPGVVRHGASVLLFPWTDAEAASPYSIEVAPGNVTIARGADQRITARLLGFDARDVYVSLRAEAEGGWQRLPMSVDEETGEFLFIVFDAASPVDYFVESNGVRSALFRIDVADLPFVQSLELEYHFPSYTGLSPQTVEPGGDVAVLRGTEVRVRAAPTMRVPGGRIALDPGEPVELDVGEDGALTGAFRVERPGFYRIELEHGLELLAGSPDYTIDVLEDQPPIVRFVRPGRDVRVSSIDEVFVEAAAEDDYGVTTLELVYALNGGEEQRVTLYGGQARGRTEVSAGHTFYLEELDLQPGDFVAYHAVAGHAARAAGVRRTSSTDIYFMEIRPFGREYRQAESGMMPGGGGGAMEVDGALSQRQREIVAATFNVVRDRDGYSDTEFQEHVVTLALAQGRLREQVETLVQRLNNRGVIPQDSAFQAIAELLPKAAEEMKAAEERLGRSEAEDALPPEQRALQHLQRAEAAYREVQVTRGQPGGGGGGPSPNAEDLADLFELELDKLRNQYETVQRGERQAAEQQVDEALERLKELARRQQQESERLRRRAAEMQGQPGGGGGDNQRRLAEETEEAARQLERLARESRSPEMQETARRLREAAEAMRRSASNSRTGGVAEAQAALERLEEARRLLERSRSAGLRRDAEDARARAERIAQAQQRIAEDVERAMSEGASAEQMRRLLERKDELGGEVAGLRSQLDRLAAESRSEQRDASRNLKEAADRIRDSKLEDKIRYSKGVVQTRQPDYARAIEEQIGTDIESVREALDDAVASIDQSGQDRTAEALDRTRDLVRGLESLDERIRDRARGEERRLRQGQQGQAGEQGQDPQADERGQQDQRADGRQAQGQQGQPGADPQGQPGQPGQQSQQGGQSGQGGQPGEQGDRAGQPGDRADVGERRAGTFGGPGGAGSLSPDDIRQFRREYRERRADAERLRRELAEGGIDVADLDALIRNLRAFEDRRTFTDLRAVDRLQAELIQGFKEFEYALRRTLEGGGAEKLFLSGSDEVPPEYRKLVEEYYRSLSNRPRR